MAAMSACMLVRCAFLYALLTTGSRMEISNTRMPITTRSSTSVNASRLRRLTTGSSTRVKAYREERRIRRTSRRDNDVVGRPVLAVGAGGDQEEPVLAAG